MTTMYVKFQIFCLLLDFILQSVYVNYPSEEYEALADGKPERRAAWQRRAHSSKIFRTSSKVESYRNAGYYIRSIDGSKKLIAEPVM